MTLTLPSSEVVIAVLHGVFLGAALAWAWYDLKVKRK